MIIKFLQSLTWWDSLAPKLHDFTIEAWYSGVSFRTSHIWSPHHSLSCQAQTEFSILCWNIPPDSFYFDHSYIHLVIDTLTLTALKIPTPQQHLSPPPSYQRLPFSCKHTSSHSNLITSGIQQNGFKTCAHFPWHGSLECIVSMFQRPFCGECKSPPSTCDWNFPMTGSSQPLTNTLQGRL